MSNKATNDTLEELHNEIAKSLLDRIKSGEATASDLNVARQFLKDNNIEGIAADDTPLNDLAEQLPDPDSSSVVVPIRN